MKIAVVSAHRGDAAFGVGLSVDAWLAAGHAVEAIACCTRSEFAPYSDAGSVHANDRVSFVTAVRKREDESWLKLYRGKLTLTDLNLKDAPLRLHVGAEEVFGLEVNLAEKAVVKLQKAIERSRAEALVVPLALDGHIDRLTLRSAALAAWSSGLPLAFYEDLPQAAQPGGDAAVERVVAALQGPLVPVFAGEALEQTGVATAVVRKRRIAWCYDSQIDEATTALIAEACVAYAGMERLWGNGAWVDAALAVRSAVEPSLG